MSQVATHYFDNSFQIAATDQQYPKGAMICLLLGRQDITPDRTAINESLRNGDGIAFRAHCPPPPNILQQAIENLVRQTATQNTLELVVIVNDKTSKCMGNTSYPLTDGQIALSGKAVSFETFCTNILDFCQKQPIPPKRRMPPLQEKMMTIRG